MDPWEEIRKMHEQMDKTFRELFSGVPKLELGKRIKNLQEYRPAVTGVTETDKEVIARFELPGIDKKNIEVNLTSDAIEVKADQKTEAKVKKKGFYKYESRQGKFFRRLALPARIQANKSKADYENGVLVVKMPKINQVKKEKGVNIKVN